VEKSRLPNGERGCTDLNADRIEDPALQVALHLCCVCQVELMLERKSSNVCKDFEAFEHSEGLGMIAKTPRARHATFLEHR